MVHQIEIRVKCPSCNHLLNNNDVLIDNLPSVELDAKLDNKKGKIYLSQVYGNFGKIFKNIDDIKDSIVEFSCPHCHKPFPVIQKCECKASMIGLKLDVGGLIKVCSRNGCQKHPMEFENIEDVILLTTKKGDQD
jgi:hypothetical protein